MIVDTMQTNPQIKKQHPSEAIENKLKQQTIENNLKGETEPQAEAKQEINNTQPTSIRQQEEEPQKKQSEEQKKQSINNQPNPSLESQQNNEGEGGEDEENWTDATESVAADEDIDIWMVDDDIVNQMEIDSAQEDIDPDHSDQEDEGKNKIKEEEEDLRQLEEQFVKGGQSDEDWRLGKHDTFCISLAIAQDGKAIFTGGGDDRLLCFHETEGKWQEFYSLKHTETVSKVQLSHDGKYVVTLTDEEIYCTDIAKLESHKLDIEEPSDVVCHKQGGVLAAAHGYSVSIYNLKGLELYATYNLDLPPLSVCFSENGKQILAACENKVRIITPKTGQIIKVAGNQFHKQEISQIATSASLVLSGCIAGQVYASGLAKGNILGRFDPFKGVINCLKFIDNFALIAPQADGLYWTDVNKFKRVFHSPQDVSVSAICRVHSPHHLAVGDLNGVIHLLDIRAPMNIIRTIRAGNTIHALEAKGSQLYAACEDGYVRVFDTSKHL